MLWYFEIVCQSSLHHLSWPSDLAQFVVRLQWLCACAFSFPRFSMSTNTQTNTTPSSDIWLDRCSIIVDWWSTPTLFGMSLMAKVAWNPDCNWIVRCEPPIMGWGHTWLHLFYPPLCPICTSPPLWNHAHCRSIFDVLMAEEIDCMLSLVEFKFKFLFFKKHHFFGLF